MMWSILYRTPEGGVIEVPNDVNISRVLSADPNWSRALIRRPDGTPEVVTLCEHRDQEVDLMATGEIVAWYCLDCARVRYAEGW